MLSRLGSFSFSRSKSFSSRSGDDGHLEVSNCPHCASSMEKLQDKLQQLEDRLEQGIYANKMKLDIIIDLLKNDQGIAQTRDSQSPQPMPSSLTSREGKTLTVTSTKVSIQAPRDLDQESSMVDSAKEDVKDFVVNEAHDLGAAAAVAGVGMLIKLASKVPVIGPFADLLGDVMTVLQNFKANRDAAQSFQKRLQHIANVLAELVQQAVKTNSSLLDYYVKQMQDILLESKGYFQRFTKSGFLRTLLMGTEPQQRFSQYDADLTKLLNECSTVVGMENLKLQAQTYDVVCNLGKIDPNRLQSDPAALEAFAKQIGADAKDLQAETKGMLEAIQRQNEEILANQDEGPHRVLDVISVRKFWRARMPMKEDVKLKFFVGFLKDYLEKNEHDKKSVIRVLAKLPTVLNTIDENHDGLVDVFELKEVCTSIPVDAALLKALKMVCERKSERPKLVPVLPHSRVAIVWGDQMKQLITDALITPNAWTTVTGPSKSGKTFRFLTAIDGLDDRAIFWLNCQDIDAEDVLLGQLELQFGLQVKKSDEVLAAFAKLIPSDGIFSFVLDCIKPRYLSAFEALFTKLGDYLATASIVLIQSSADADQISTRSLPLPENVMGSIRELTVEPMDLDDAIRMARELGALEPELLCSAAERLPGKVITMNELPIRSIRVIANRFNPVSNGQTNGGDQDSSLQLSSAELVAIALSHDCKIVAACLYPALRNGVGFGNDMAWYLCTWQARMEPSTSHMLSSDIDTTQFPDDRDLWNDTMKALAASGWLEVIEDGQYRIASDSVLPPPADLAALGIEIDSVNQIDRYYAFVADEINMIETLLHSKEFASGSVKFNSLKKHIDAYFGCLALPPPSHVPMPSDPAVVVAMFPESGFYQIQGQKLTEATKTKYLEDILNHSDRAIVLARERFGEKHLSFGYVSKNVASVLNDVGRNEESLVLYKQAAEIIKANLGDEDALIGEVLTNTGCVLFEMERNEEALDTFREALTIRKAVLGPQHEDVGNTVYNMAFVYSALGREEDALATYREALAIDKVALGETHAIVGMILNCMGFVLDNLGRREEAVAAFREALAVRKIALGDQHEDVEDTLNRMAAVLRSLGRHQEAREASQQAQAISRARSS